jgi:hypothetical protein
MGLQSLEDRLERMVEGVFRRASRSRVRPIDIGRHLVRAIEDHRESREDGTVVVPHSYVVMVHPDDDRELAPMRDALVSELAQAVREYVRLEDLVLVGPVSIVVQIGDDLRPGRVAIEASAPSLASAPSPSSALSPSAPTSSVATSSSSGVPSPQSTAAATLVLATGERIQLASEPVTIGRLASCDITIADPNASRRHAEVRSLGRGFVVVDLGSTNGTLVNGLVIDGDRPLHDGDVISVGSTDLRFEDR